jgi:CDGSH iron-sulfur domain-containing protein 3
MSTPTIARRLPIPVDVIAGKTYFWCACGESKNQPFCDGSHKGTDFLPLEWTATETEKTFFCACKHTGNPPFCDSTHGTL